MSLVFSFTHPYGCDYPYSSCQMRTCHFNSRTHTGATLQRLRNCLHTRISTHAPIRVRLSAIISIIPFFKFQLTHPYGCDSKNREIFPTLSVLIGYIIQHNPLFFKYFLLFISNFIYFTQISGANPPGISCSLGVRT